MSAFANALQGNTTASTATPGNVPTNEHLAKIRAGLEHPGAVITGIGSRETPTADLRLLTAIAKSAEERGMRGRSGGAGGADLAFEKGFSDPKNVDVILPWKTFLPKGMTQADVTAYLGRERIKSGPGAPVMLEGEYIAKARAMAAEYHPAWDKCSDGAKSLHSRNMPQVLGMQLNQPTDVVIAWTVDGKATGGTGQAIRVAEDLGIAVANLKNPAERKIVLEVLGLTDPAIEMHRAQAQSQGFGR